MDFETIQIYIENEIGWKNYTKEKKQKSLFYILVANNGWKDKRFFSILRKI